MYDLIIVGGGPAGISASIYAARKKMNFLLVSRDIGGQVLTSGNIENYLGFSEVDGVQLVERMIEHMNRFNIVPLSDEVTAIEKMDKGFRLKTLSGKTLEARTLLLCTGSEHRKLGVPGEKEFTGFGVSYCYTCDAPFYRDRSVVVVGGGNAGFEAAEQLLQYAKHITIVELTDTLRADEILKEKVLSSDKVKVLLRHGVKEIKGDSQKGVTAVILEDLDKGEVYEYPTDGVFVEIGLVPNTDIVENLDVLRNDRKEIIVDCNNRTSEKGIYAAGDCTNVVAKQIITAAGEGAKALLSVYHDLTYGYHS